MTAAAMPQPRQHRAGRAVLAAIAGTAPPPKCNKCKGSGTDRFGFDCLSCFGTGEAENE